MPVICPLTGTLSLRGTVTFFHADAFRSFCARCWTLLPSWDCNVFWRGHKNISNWIQTISFSGRAHFFAHLFEFSCILSDAIRFYKIWLHQIKYSPTQLHCYLYAMPSALCLSLYLFISISSVIGRKHRAKKNVSITSLKTSIKSDGIG